MKKTAIGIVAMVVAALAGMGLNPRVGDGQGLNALEGTWEHTFENDGGLRQIKVINQDHFIWVTYVKETGMPVTTVGGPIRSMETYTRNVWSSGGSGRPSYRREWGRSMHSSSRSTAIR